MKFLILIAAFVAVASADYHDDTFHFSTLGSSAGVSGGFHKQSSGFLHQAKALSGFTAVPAVAKHFTTVHQAPVYAAVHQVPVYAAVHHQAPVYAAVHHQAPVYAAVHHQAPVYTAVHHQAPVYTAVHHPAPVYTAVHHHAPVYTAVKHVAAAPLLVKSVAQTPVFSQQPLFSQQYSVSSEVAKPAFAQEYSAQSRYAAAAPQFRILSQVQESDPAGPYKLSYATENGIQASEQGALVAGAEGAVVAAQGSYSYTGPDGKAYSVSYIADENGFRAAGDHLPTPPPIPAEILKSLEENAASNERYDDQGRLLRK